MADQQEALLQLYLRELNALDSKIERNAGRYLHLTFAMGATIAAVIMYQPAPGCSWLHTVLVGALPLVFLLCGGFFVGLWTQSLSYHLMKIAIIEDLERRLNVQFMSYDRNFVQRFWALSWLGPSAAHGLDGVKRFVIVLMSALTAGVLTYAYVHLSLLGTAFTTGWVVYAAGLVVLATLLTWRAVVLFNRVSLVIADLRAGQPGVKGGLQSPPVQPGTVTAQDLHPASQGDPGN